MNLGLCGLQQRRAAVGALMTIERLNKTTVTIWFCKKKGQFCNDEDSSSQQSLHTEQVKRGAVREEQ